ncbi:phage tail sheath family protein [Longispora albida]|uniref:phage tail sheath family protein n=1 Tax=Longispora albida TaxID=203523 RepID=UPI000360A74A|nr:phage tail sheath C-terminal domain-containing protein [Longispora albida]
MSVTGLSLGAPGVYRSPAAAGPSLQPVRLDVAGFCGVALRGPVNVPVAVTSWSDYQRIFGGYERPGGGPDRMLPYAVRAFFAQGGTRAVIVRVAAAGDGAGAVARYRAGALELVAADEGSWGNGLAIRFSYEVTTTWRAAVPEPGMLRPPAGAEVPVGTLLRLRGAGLAAVGEYRWVTGTSRDLRGHLLLGLDAEVEASEVDGEVIGGVLDLTDPDPAFTRRERISGLGLRPGHPRHPAAVLATESALVRTAPGWLGTLEPDGPVLRQAAGELVHAGSDRWHQITVDSFFDEDPAGADVLDERKHLGVDLLGRDQEIGLLCVPDLFWSWRGATGEPVSEVVADVPRDRCTEHLTAPAFGSCCHPRTRVTIVDGCVSPCPEPARAVPYAPAQVPPALLDSRDPEQLGEMTERQARLVAVAELRRRFVVLLDVPPGLPAAGISRWRARFTSSYAAAYHPWLRVSRSGTAQNEALAVPPSIFAVGIIAARERRLGLPWGPAGELAAGAVAGTDRITDAVHDQLHLHGVNVFREERDGFRLTAARTLAADPAYQQLSVRRLMTMLALTLERQCQWLVFEPNTAGLRAQLSDTITALLRALGRAGAFAGRTEADSFFVHCDDRLNTPPSLGQGRLIAEVGVAPASPLEYLVLRISQDTDGRVHVEAAP